MGFAFGYQGTINLALQNDRVYRIADDGFSALKVSDVRAVNHRARPACWVHATPGDLEDRLVLLGERLPGSSGSEPLTRHHVPVIRTPSLESACMPEAIGWPGLTVGAAQPVSVSPRRTMTKTARVYKIEMLIRMGTGEAVAKALLKRVKIIGSAKRPVSSQFFELIGESLLTTVNEQRRAGLVANGSEP